MNKNYLPNQFVLGVFALILGLLLAFSTSVSAERTASIGSGTATSTFAGGVSAGNSVQANGYIEAKKPSETYARSYLDGFGSLNFGGTGSAPTQFKFSKDSGTASYINLTNVNGPASILIVDSNDANSGGPDTESTLTLRRNISSNTGTEFMDLFNDGYTSNGDVINGLLFQNTGTGIQRNFISGFYSKADTDPNNQVKNAQVALSISTSTVTGVAGNYSEGLVGIQKRYANAVLDVNNSTTTDPFMISSSTTNGSIVGVSFIVKKITGNVGIGTSTPNVYDTLQIASTTPNATTTLEIGKTNQTKGSCLTLYRTDGSVVYAFVAAGATTFTLSTNICY